MTKETYYMTNETYYSTKLVRDLFQVRLETLVVACRLKGPLLHTPTHTHTHTHT
jgi:hypothetical protein